MARLTIVQSPPEVEALKERDRFLDEHPELRRLQSEIDRKLQNAESDHNRLVLLHKMMMDSFVQMNQNLQRLVELRKKARLSD